MRKTPTFPLKDMENEIWVPFKLRPDLYEISNTGKIRSLGRISKLKMTPISGRTLKTTVNRNGYEVFSVDNTDRIRKTFKMHRAVADHFIPNPENKPHINHKDLNKINNCVDNLEWCTPKENVHHAMSMGRMKSGRKIRVKTGPRAGYFKIINIETGEIFEHAKDLFEKTGIRHSYIRRRLCGERYNQTPYRYLGREHESIPKPPIRLLSKGKPIAVFNSDWVLLQTFQHTSIACEFYSVHKDSVRRFLRGEYSSVKGYKFKLIDAANNFIEPVAFVSKRKPKIIRIKKDSTEWKAVYKYSLTGELIHTFPSINRAAIACNMDRSNLKKIVGGKKSSLRPGYYKGHFYRYT